MNSMDRARSATDDEIISVLDSEWRFTHYVSWKILGNNVKSADPIFKTKLIRLTKAGRVIRKPWTIRGQEQWKLP